MTKQEARIILVREAFECKALGLSASEFEEIVDVDFWRLSENAQKAVGIIPEAIPHIIAWVWTFKR